MGARDRLRAPYLMAQRSLAAVRLLALNGNIAADDAAQEAIDRAWELRFKDVRAMLDWAHLAVDLAESPNVSAAAHAHLGNALRISGRFTEARKELDLAKKVAKPSAVLLEFEASLL